MIDQKLKEALAELGISIEVDTMTVGSGGKSVTYKMSYCSVGGFTEKIDRLLGLIYVEMDKYRSLTKTNIGHLDNLRQVEKLLGATWEFISGTGY